MEIKFWENKEAGQVNPRIFAEVPEEWVKKILNGGRNEIDKPTQLRKFYDEAHRFKEKIDRAGSDKEGTFKTLLPYFRMLKAKAAYAQGRKHISDSFKKMLEKSIDQVKDYKDLKVFMTFFEAFMGYHKYYKEGGGKGQIQSQSRGSGGGGNRSGGGGHGRGPQGFHRPRHAR